MKHTFEYFPIETAPKDRDVMVFDGQQWHRAAWLVVNTIGGTLGYGWRNEMREQIIATHWAEIEAMKPGGAD